MAPTYFCRFPGSSAPTASAAPHSLSSGVMVQSIPIDEVKAALRREALARRDALAADTRAAAAEAIAARKFPVEIKPAAIVSGFSPMRTEIDPTPLMRKLGSAGAKLALPVVAGRGQPLIMRAWNFGDPLARGVWGIRQPMSSAPEVAPGIVLVPLTVFDRRGHRIGYGAGYYDMTITKLRAQKSVVAVGIAFAVQEVDEVPITPRDARLDLVLTEREVIDCRGT
jgi:5-formyltetrahydrofolate cyclo-ligase